MTWSGRVVVITGATSGIGRAAALEFARRGSGLVLAGRRLEALLQVAAECRALGVPVLARATDVTREEQVHALCTAAMYELGRIDVWVNNAGVTLFGRLDQGTFAEHERVVATNLFGAMYAARAVVPVFRRQACGTMINVGSVLSQIGQPFVPSYVISKFALRGLTDALRAELANEPDIHVCSLLPYAVDTEHFESGANRVGLEPHPLPPTQTPEKVARALANLAEHPRRELYVPRAAVLGLGLHALFPQAVEQVLFDALARWHFADREQPPTRGNLFHAQRPGGAVHGARQPRVSTSSLLLFALRRFAEIGLRRALGKPVRPSASPVLATDPVAAARALHDTAS